MLNPESYDGARVLEASGRPMLVIGRSYWIVPIQDDDVNTEAGTKFFNTLVQFRPRGVLELLAVVTRTGHDTYET